ncbi:hypothetical protein J6590_096519, partial [Homalodisca vitripennis]
SDTRVVGHLTVWLVLSKIRLSDCECLGSHHNTCCVLTVAGSGFTESDTRVVGISVVLQKF